MKRYCFIILVMLITVTESIAATSIGRIAQWPYSSTFVYLQPSPNSVATGDHSAYPEGIVLWSIGDTISVLNADGLSEITSFRVNTNKTIKDICYKDEAGVETLYLALGTDGLKIFDFTDLSSSTLSTPAGSYAVTTADPGYLDSEEIDTIDATGIGYYNNRIFLADNYFGLRVIDVTDMAAPFETVFTTPVEIVLGYVWIYNPSTEMDEQVTNTITRTSGYIQPNVVGTYDTTGGYNNLEVLAFDGKTYAFVHDYYWGLRVFDVTDPEASIDDPVSKSMVTDDWFFYSALLNDIYVAVGSDYDEDNPTDRLYAYVTAVDSIGSSVVARLDILSDDGVLEYENDDTDYPSITNIGRCLTDGTASGIYVTGDHIYVADGTSGLQIVDISDGDPVSDSSPVLDYQVAGSYDTGGDMWGLSLAGRFGDTIYLHDAYGGLHEIDIDITANDDVDTSLGAGGTKSPAVTGDSVYVDDDFAYCLDSDNGFRIFDVSEPASLSLQGFYQTMGNDIAVSDNYAYIAKGDDGLEIVNVTTKTAPVLAGSMDTAGSAVAVAVYQNDDHPYACVADSGSGLAVIDVNTPTNPGAPVIVAGTGTVNDLSISGDYAYLAEDSGLTIVDLSNAPVYSVVGAKNTDANTITVGVYTTVTDGISKVYALISDSTGIMIEDVTDPENIPATTIATIDTIDGQPFVSLEVIENYLFVAAGINGVYLYDISTPAAPQKIDNVSSMFSAKEVSPFKNDEAFYFASAEDANVIAVYDLNFGDDLGDPLSDSGDSLSCFISSLE